MSKQKLVWRTFTLRQAEVQQFLHPPTSLYGYIYIHTHTARSCSHSVTSLLLHLPCEGRGRTTIQGQAQAEAPGGSAGVREGTCCPGSAVTPPCLSSAASSHCRRYPQRPPNGPHASGAAAEPPSSHVTTPCVKLRLLKCPGHQNAPPAGPAAGRRTAHPSRGGHSANTGPGPARRGAPPPEPAAGRPRSAPCAACHRASPDSPAIYLPSASDWLPADGSEGTAQPVGAMPRRRGRGAHAEAGGRGVVVASGGPRRQSLLMAGWPLVPALFLALLRAQPCPCGRAPASPQAVTARLAAKWPATPLLLEARCVQPPPLPAALVFDCRAVRPGRGSSDGASPGCLLRVGGASLRGQEKGRASFLTSAG